MVSPTRPRTPGTSGSSTSTRLSTSGAPSTASPDRAVAAESRSPVVPTLSIALPHVDRGAARNLLDTFADLLDRADAQSSLEGDHANLQRAYVAQRERTDRLEREIDAAYANASPYVLFCQRQYDILYRRCQDAQRLAADFECVVRERLDNSRDIAAICDRLRLEQDVHTEEIARLHAEIDSLTQQLAAAVAAAHENSSSELAQPLTGSRSSLRRRSADTSTGGSPNRPIDVGSPDSSEASNGNHDRSGDAGGGDSPRDSSDDDHRSSHGDNSERSDQSSDNNSQDGDGDQTAHTPGAATDRDAAQGVSGVVNQTDSDDSVISEPRSHRNQLLNPG
ncbi:uncharacterized protein KRP23_10374 [Phytophthora ramorum]|uniref:uncharacterized protein n=1 Tax=Phytophthora ramorum TaxID=164328 RepID=UPI0030AEFBDE|nr:hypothetical protein KRP23_10374 [Phytophthora ramorum]